MTMLIFVLPSHTHAGVVPPLAVRPLWLYSEFVGSESIAVTGTEHAAVRGIEYVVVAVENIGDRSTTISDDSVAIVVCGDAAAARAESAGPVARRHSSRPSTVAPQMIVHRTFIDGPP